MQELRTAMYPLHSIRSPQGRPCFREVHLETYYPNASLRDVWPSAGSWPLEVGDCFSIFQVIGLYDNDGGFSEYVILCWSTTRRLESKVHFFIPPMTHAKASC